MKFAKLWISFVVLSAVGAVDGAVSHAAAADPQVDIKTNMGTIRLELYAAKAPKSVENFLQYVKDGHYDGTIFHRVIKNFMIQGGGFDKDMRQKPTRAQIKNEAANGLTNDIGTVAMARTSVRDSATSQFFVNTKNNDFLNYSGESSQGGGYAVFGKVVSGMDIVMKIGETPTASGDVPKSQVVIESVSLVEAANK
ncbi:MAG: peptidyl-prolyl cis-trans isomerase [Betaproteobacteria bacterium]|nr:peptidyl-prolyl cis-trans isomerase [Betaproteobacteria bacterium]